MTDEQCQVIVDAIKELTNAIHIVGEKIEGISSYDDCYLRGEVSKVASILRIFMTLNYEQVGIIKRMV